jgi:glutamate synthase domain-containing protein 2
MTIPILCAVAAILATWIIFDICQRKHAIVHNFPIIGHFRYWLESIGPELRQYIVTGNNEERPFSRDQRRWVYASSKLENNYFGFGTDNDLESSPNYLIIKHSAFPLAKPHPSKSADTKLVPIPCCKVLGKHRQRARAVRPPSVVNTSAMSFGSLSGRAIQAVNQGAKLADCWQNTGEGGVSVHHRQGGHLIWQIGTGYFGCRTPDGRFDPKQFIDVIAAVPEIRAIEIKLSQGAKPGVGGFLPAAKVSAEIAAARGIPVGQDCASPPRHSAFGDVDSLLDFVEHVSELSGGLPIGIKSAVGETQFWIDLALQMAATDRGVDFITIDGGEGGTGAAPLVFTDHVALPFKLGFSRVFREFAKLELDDKVVFVGSGKLGFPGDALLAFALGCDMIHVGREAMLAIGCIQAQRCHTGNCPTGVATQSRWLSAGLDPERKSARLANYVGTLRKELLQLCHTCHVIHPALITTQDFEILDERFRTVSATECFRYHTSWGVPAEEDRQQISAIMADLYGTTVE